MTESIGHEVVADRARQSLGRVFALNLASLTLVLTFLSPAQLRGQDRATKIALELQIGATHEVACLVWCESETTGGWAAGGDVGVALRVTPRAALTFAVSHYGVELTEGASPLHGQGASLGMRWVGGGGPWIEGGGILHRRQVRFFPSGQEPVTVYSNLGLGFQFSVGVTIPVSRSVAVSPMVQLRRFSSQVEVPAAVFGESTRSERTTSFFMLGLRVSARLRDP